MVTEGSNVETLSVFVEPIPIDLRRCYARVPWHRFLPMDEVIDHCVEDKNESFWKSSDESQKCFEIDQRVWQGASAHHGMLNASESSYSYYFYLG